MRNFQSIVVFSLSQNFSLIILALLSLGLTTAQAQVPEVVPGFPTNETGTPGTLLYRQIGLNRVTNVAYHNGLVYTHEVGGGNPRRWRFTDVDDPTTFTNEQTGEGVGPFSDHGTHGHFKIGEWLGGRFGTEIRRQSPGVNVLDPLPGFTYLNSETLAQPGDSISRMYYPWGTPFNWIEYGALTGNGYLFRGSEKIVEWPMLAEHGVAGNSILLGNLLIVTSDESNMGILCYDISPAFETPAQAPVLLDKLDGSVGAYIASVWEHYIVLSRRDTSTVDIVDFSDPTNLQYVTSIDVTGDAGQDLGNGLGYVQCQDNFIFADRHKINMDTFQTVLEFDEVGNDRPAGSVSGALDMSQHMMPMGNLIVTGGYSISGADGVGVWIHDSQPDTNPPYVGYHVPRPGQTNFPLGAPVSLLIHENLESYTIINGETVILRPTGGEPVEATVSFSYDDVLTITPTAYLEDDTTYEVEIVAGGIKDVSGNGILPYTFSFSTGSGVVGGNASPVITSFAANPSPATPGSEIDFTATATDGDADSLEYRFTFGEAGAVRDWDSSATASHTYATAGHYGVKVQVRDVRTGTALSTVTQTGTVSVVAEAPLVQPTKSSPMALNTTTRQIWAVNPDNNSVSLIDADTRVLISEIDLNSLLSIAGSVDPRSVAIDAAGNAWITCRDANCLVVLNSAGALLEAIAYDYGSTPMGVAISPDGLTAFVTMEGLGELRRYATASRTETGSLPLGPMPRAMAITADGARVLVTRFISDEEYGEIWDVDASAMTLNDRIALHRDRGRDSSSSGRGVPNYVSSITIHPSGDFAYYTAIKSNTQRGDFFDLGQNTNNSLDPDNTIRAMVGRIDLATNEEPFVSQVTTYRIDIDNSESPTSLEFSPSGDYFFVSIQGNNHVAIFDDLLIRTLPRSVSVKTTKGRFATGLAPQGLLFDSLTNRLFSTDFMGRSVTVHEMDSFLSFGGRETNRMVISKVGSEALSSDVLLGKQIFYQAADGSGLSSLPTMSQEGYISCASCHVDGQHDGMTWDFTQRGEGLRNTTDLRGRAGLAHGNVHWTGNFDEIQDFVLDVVNQFGGGEGLLPEGETPNDSLGAPNAGRSTELDALAAYVTSLGVETLPRSPHRNPFGTRTASALAGEQVFQSQNCATCHSGSDFTSSTLGAASLLDAGTLRTSSGQRLGGSLTGIDPPTLLGLWASAPYFHDGSAKTLDEVFRVAGGEVLQAEDAVLGAGADIPSYPRLNEDSSMHGQMVSLDAGETVTFNNVDGGTVGGAGDLELRWMISFYGSPGIVTVTVNGVDHQIDAARPLGNNESSANQWQRLRIEDVQFTAGETNTIVVSSSSTGCGLDDVTVITPDHRTAAVHRSALTLETEDYNNLKQYLLQLDGSGNVQPDNPTVVISAVQTSPSSLPYAEFDIVFSEQVTDFEEADLELSGAAVPNATALYVYEEGLHYRLRMADFAQDGTVTVELPAGRVAAVDDGLTNLVAEPDSLVYFASDTLAIFSDEFDDSSSLSNWQRNYEAEGWGVDKLETWDIDTSRAGHMRAMPYSSSWFRNWTGALAYKEVTGDFVVTMRMEVSRRNGQLGRPTSDFSLGGIMVRSPRGLTNAAPDPDPGQAVTLPWPPPAEGQPNYYTTPWQEDSENYIFLSFGHTSATFASVDNTWSCEVKTTIDGNSTLYGVQSGIPENNGLVTLQCIRRGSTFLLLRRHGEEGPWIIENRFERTDMPETLQIGLTTYTDWNSVSSLDEFHHNRTVTLGGNPDLVADVDYFRLHRPNGSVTAEMLQAVNITGQYGQPSLLSNTALASLLGDAAGGAADGQSYEAWLSEHFTTEQLLDPQLTDLDSDYDQDNQVNLLDYLIDGDPAGGDPAMKLQTDFSGETPMLTLGRNSQARGRRLMIEASSDLLNWDTLAESWNGGVPTGPGFISETPGVMRLMTVEDIVTGEESRFYRVMVSDE